MSAVLNQQLGKMTLKDLRIAVTEQRELRRRQQEDQVRTLASVFTVELNSLIFLSASFQSLPSPSLSPPLSLSLLLSLPLSLSLLSLSSLQALMQSLTGESGDGGLSFQSIASEEAVGNRKTSRQLKELAFMQDIQMIQKAEAQREFPTKQATTEPLNTHRSLQSLSPSLCRSSWEESC